MVSLSIVVPVFNSRLLLPDCLEAIIKSISPKDELIVVDDASTDLSYEIAEKFTTKTYQLKENQGPSTARNIGMEKAVGDIVIFIDSDVEVSREVIENIREFFEKDKTTQTLTINVSPKDLKLGFWSDYKNLYMNFVISRAPTVSNYVYGACCATRRTSAISWPTELRRTEDSLWGLQQVRLGLKVLCRKDIQIIHRKKYDLFILINNDFNIASAFAENFLRQKRWKTLYSNEAFGHTAKTQKLSVILATSILFISLITPTVSGALLVFWLVLNLRFWIFLFHKRGTLFVLRSIIWTFLDHLIYAGGILNGALRFFLSRKMH